MPIKILDFDPTGVLPANHITYEPHTLYDANEDYDFVLPTYGPFYLNDLSVTKTLPDDSVVTLVQGVDYYPIMFYKAATIATGKAVYAGIAFNSRSDTVVRVTYRSIGGIWVTNTTGALKTLSRTLYNPRVIFYDQITPIPTAFPPVEHAQPVAAVDGMNRLLAAIGGIENAIRSEGPTATLEYLINHRDNNAVINELTIKVADLQNRLATLEK